MNRTRDKEDLVGHYKKLDSFKNQKDYVALDPEHSENELEFEQYGNRLAGYLCRRLEAHTKTPLEYQELLEIGCGMGRLMKPFCSRLNFVIGVDMSKEILQAAKEHLTSIPNFRLVENNGLDLSSITDDSVDIALTGGVFQHIPSRSIIESYILEALRVTKLGGLFIFTFQVWQTNIEGKNRVGAKFTADWLNTVFQKTHSELLEVACDPLDPIPHYSVIVKKTADPFKDDFNTFKVESIPWRSLCWQGLKTKASELEMTKSPQRQITFYDSEN